MMAMPGRISYHIPAAPLPAPCPPQAAAPGLLLAAAPLPPAERCPPGAVGPGGEGGEGRGPAGPGEAQPRGRGGRWGARRCPGPGMKEDKENARPKERRGGPGPAVGAGAGAGAGSEGRAGGAELERLERPKDKKEALSKVRPAPARP